MKAIWRLFNPFCKHYALKITSAKWKCYDCGRKVKYLKPGRQYKIVKVIIKDKS